MNRNFVIKFLPFALLFGLIPYRVGVIFHADFYSRLLIGFVTILLFCFVMEKVVPFLLNQVLTQLFFFYCLSFENFMYQMSKVGGIIFSFCFFFNLGAWPITTQDPFFWYGLFLILFSLYFHFKRIFLNPAFDGSLYNEPEFISSKNSFTWDHLVLNMSAISKLLFHTPVVNQLGPSLSSKDFPLIAKRYVFTRVFHFAKTNPEALTIGGAVGALTGFATGQVIEQRRHSEILVVQQEANRIAQENLAVQQEANRIAQENLDLLKHKSRSNIDKNTGCTVSCALEDVYSQKFLFWLNYFY